jgi:hypothetical protein
MPAYDFIIVEMLPPCNVAFFGTEYPGDDKTDTANIGPLFDLFCSSSRKTCAGETGRETTQEETDKWMGPTRFHLPPTIRWMCHLDMKDGRPSRDSLEMWMMYSDRVVLSDYAHTKAFPGGCFASLELGFDKTVTEAWDALELLLKKHELTAIGDSAYIQNMQAINHGGWDRFRAMVEVDESQVEERGWVV